MGTDCSGASRGIVTPAGRLKLGPVDGKTSMVYVCGGPTRLPAWSLTVRCAMPRYPVLRAKERSPAAEIDGWVEKSSGRSVVTSNESAACGLGPRKILYA